METAEVCDEHDRALVAVGASEPPLFQVIDIEQLGRDHDRPSRRPPPSGVRPMPPPIPFPRSTPARTAPSAQESVMTEPTPITSSPPKRVCRVPGCRDRHAAHGLCGRHNGRVALMRLRDELPTWTDEDFAAFDVRWEAHTAKKNTQVVEATTPVDTDTDTDTALAEPITNPVAYTIGVDPGESQDQTVVRLVELAPEEVVEKPVVGRLSAILREERARRVEDEFRVAWFTNSRAAVLAAIEESAYHIEEARRIRVLAASVREVQYVLEGDEVADATVAAETRIVTVLAVKDALEKAALDFEREALRFLEDPSWQPDSVGGGA